MTDRRKELHFVISEWWDQTFSNIDEIKPMSISNLVEYIMELEEDD
tara:strand:- start:115 stop:252 length:138 start_codon:yes stop_codon:yes gene_type:complete